jgi:DGQHR domain-containing protein
MNKLKKQAAVSKTRVRLGKPKELQLQYDAFEFTQRNVAQSGLVIFHASVKDVLSWSTVGVLGPDSMGHQREKREAKVRAISKFLRADRRNIIPTAVVLAFTKGAAKFTRSPDHEASGFGVLSIVRKPESANIVGGQHRVYGMEEYNSETHVAIVGLLDADDLEKAFQFLVINNKSTKVPATHAKALLAKMKNTKLSERLRGARLAFDAEGIRDVDILNTDTESPFYNCIDWSTTEEDSRMVQATAIEASLSHLGNLSVPELDDRDVRRSVFSTIWKTVKTAWPDLWGNGSRLISKVGIVCLTRFIIDTITKWADSDELEIDILDPDQVEKQTIKILKYMDKRFWTQPWATTASGGFDTNQGRERVLKALTQLYRNGKREVEWSSDIEIIEPVKQ